MMLSSFGMYTIMISFRDYASAGSHCPKCFDLFDTTYTGSSWDELSS